jgi:8-oxo-dGTP pyrophosphatase MutT (NUDIX family)
VDAVSAVRVCFVDVYVVRKAPGGLECLVLRRSPGGRCTGAWEAVHGSIEAGETPVDAARRELAEETGLTAVRWYNLSRVEAFYRHRADEVALIPAFVAVVSADAAVRLGPEHDRSEWLTVGRASDRLAWPRERRAVADIQVLLEQGDAGPLEDVLGIPDPVSLSPPGGERDRG